MGKQGDSDIFLKPVPTQRASEAIYEQIKDLIINGQLKPGDRLPSERHLMDMLQRSRPTIREALRMLERVGFIRTVPGTNGSIVQEMGTSGVEQSLEIMLQTSKVSLTELAEYRMHNEMIVVRWAALRRTEEDIALLEDILAKSKKCIEDEDFHSFTDLDSAFHCQLAKCSKNEVAYILTKVFMNLSIQKIAQPIQQLEQDENRDMCCRILKMHQNIFCAIKAGDIDTAAEEMVKHIQVFMEDLNKFE